MHIVKRIVTWLALGVVIGAVSAVLVDTCLFFVSRDFFCDALELWNADRPYLFVVYRALGEGAVIGLVCQVWVIYVWYGRVPAGSEGMRIVRKALARILMIGLIVGLSSAIAYTFSLTYPPRDIRPNFFERVDIFRYAFVMYSIQGMYVGALLHLVLSVHDRNISAPPRTAL